MSIFSSNTSLIRQLIDLSMEWYELDSSAHQPVNGITARLSNSPAIYIEFNASYTDIFYTDIFYAILIAPCTEGAEHKGV